MPASAHIIVFGSPRAGAGTSRAAFHAATGLARLGYRVASVDLDADHRSLSRFMAERLEYAELNAPDLPCPVHMELDEEHLSALREQDKIGKDYVRDALDGLRDDFEFIVIDTPASGDFFADLARTYSDTLITVTGPDLTALPGIAHTVRDLREIGRARHWIVLCEIEDTALLHKLSAGWRSVTFVPAWKQADLPHPGLTLLDLRDHEGIDLTLPLLESRQRVRQLLRAISR